MKKKMSKVFAAVLAAAVVAGVSGCFNPVQPGANIPSSADAPSTDGTFTNGTSTNGTFTVTLPVGGGDEGPGVPDSRAVVGPDAYGIQWDAIRNIAQLIVVNADGEVDYFHQTSQKTSKDKISKFTVTGLAESDTDPEGVGRYPYDFLLLMGHQERDYAAESGSNGEYKYKDGSPTLLAAGLLEGKEIIEGINSITITMYPLIVDTVFKQGENVVEAALPSAQPGGARLFPGIDAEVVWTLTGGGFAELLRAQGKIAAEDATGIGWGDEDPLPNSDKKIGLRLQIDGSIDGSLEEKGAPLSDNQIIMKLKAQNEKTAGSAYFNVTYLPFGAGNLKVFTDIEPNTAAAEWIIRNGVNDKAMDVKTVFPNAWTTASWNDNEDDTGRNGNGAVAFTFREMSRIDLTGQIPVPAAGAVPVTALTGDYGGSVVWTAAGKSTKRFEGETIYTAMVTLTPPAGFQFSGDGVTVSHSGAKAIIQRSKTASKVEVEVLFPATGVWEYEGYFSETSSSAEVNSVIDIISLAKTDEFSSLSLKLVNWPETVNLGAEGTDIGAGLALTAAGNSPPAVIIDGGGKTITLGSGTGSVITVGAGVTLTLQNITFTGNSGNTQPLIKVATGGTLILETGAVIKDNKDTGVFIDGGAAEMRIGAEVKKNGRSGVIAENGGGFIMYGGIISGNARPTGNGGGVSVSDSSFTMEGGIISDNTAGLYGGGVYVNGTFIKTKGTIYGSDGGPDANIANVSSNKKSHAVFFKAGAVIKRRALTAGADVSLNGATDGGWDN